MHDAFCFLDSCCVSLFLVPVTLDSLYLNLDQQHQHSTPKKKKSINELKPTPHTTRGYMAYGSKYY